MTVRTTTRHESPSRTVALDTNADTQKSRDATRPQPGSTRHSRTDHVSNTVTFSVVIDASFHPHPPTVSRALAQPHRAPAEPKRLPQNTRPRIPPSLYPGSPGPRRSRSWRIGAFVM